MAALADAERRESLRLYVPAGLERERTPYLNDDSLKSLAVVQLKDKDYLLPTAVLSEHSPVIRDAIFGQRGDTVPRIQIKGIDDKTFDVIAQYMLTKEAKVNAQNVIDVYHAAYSLKIKPLEVICWNKVFQKDPSERSLPAWVAAKRLNMPNEEQQLYRYITHNFDEISTTDSFLELDPNQLKEILQADVVKADNELSLYKALMRWIHHDCKARQKYARTLVEAIRFQNMTPEQVQDFKDFPICPEVKKCFDISDRIPQLAEIKPDKAREYAPAKETVALPEFGEATRPVASVEPAAAVAPEPRPVLSPPKTDVPAVQTPPQVAAVASPLPQKPKPSEPVVLSIEQQKSILPPPEPEIKKELKGEEKENDASKDKGVTGGKPIKETSEKEIAAEEKKEVEIGLGSEATAKVDQKTEEVEKQEPREKKADSLGKPDARGDNVLTNQKDTSDEKHKDKLKTRTLRAATSEILTASTAAATQTEPTSAATVPLPTVEGAPGKDKKKKKDKDKKRRDKKEKGKDKKSKGKSGKPPKKRSFCPWFGSRKGSKQYKNKAKGGGKSKEGASKDAIRRNEGKPVDASKDRKLKKEGKKGSSREGSSRSRSKEKVERNKGGNEKAVKGGKQKAKQSSKDKLSKERVGKQNSKDKNGGKDKLSSKEKRTKDKHSKHKHSKEKVSKEKSSSRDKNHAGSKSDSFGAGSGGIGKEWDALLPAKKRKDTASVDMPGGDSGGGGLKSGAKRTTSPSSPRKSSSKKTHSSSTHKASGKTSKSSTLPRRRPDKGTTALASGFTEILSAGGGGCAHHRMRSANRLPLGSRRSDLSLVGSKSMLLTVRERRSRRLSKAPHRALTATSHTFDLTVGVLEQIAADRQMDNAVLGGLAADSKDVTREGEEVSIFGDQLADDVATEIHKACRHNRLLIAGKQCCRCPCV
ncbi:uncharacterized protein LOC144146230 [Haemaphysalis longicornis]